MKKLSKKYLKKWKEWDKLWRRDVSEIGFTRRNTDIRARNLSKMKMYEDE